MILSIVVTGLICMPVLTFIASDMLTEQALSASDASASIWVEGIA